MIKECEISVQRDAGGTRVVVKGALGIVGFVLILVLLWDLLFRV